MAGSARRRTRRDARASGFGHRDRTLQTRGLCAGGLHRDRRNPEMMFTALVGRSLARHRALIIAVAVLLSAFQTLDVVVAYNFQANGLYAQFATLVPAFIQE